MFFEAGFKGAVSWPIYFLGQELQANSYIPSSKWENILQKKEEKE